MTAYFKNYKTGETFDVVMDEWDLGNQFTEVKIWIKKNSKIFNKKDWIIDIDYSDLERPNVVACGYTLDVDLMKLLVKYYISLWLSSYGERFVKMEKKFEKQFVKKNRLDSTLKWNL